MINWCKYILVLSILLSGSIIRSQDIPVGTCSIKDGRLIFVFDVHWNASERYQTAKRFDLDSLLVEKAYMGETEIISGNTRWSVKKMAPDKIELSKNLDTNLFSGFDKSDIFMIDESWENLPAVESEEAAEFGVNKFNSPAIFSYKNGIAQFYLAGYIKARKVIISGSFNNWSSLNPQMQATDSGWIAKLKLKPGKYTYKYIIDGKWKTDPANKEREWDGKNGYNSVVYCTNYIFYLNGQLNARKVLLAGSFNKWKPNEIYMNKTEKGWEAPVYLKEGTHAYKFIVDNEWITDPANKDVRKDADGNLNSFIGLGDTCIFKLEGYTDAKEVILSGSFNGWSTNELVMQKTSSGWILPYVLAPGNYSYKFIVDGRWMPDPSNPLATGSGKFTNSVLVFKPNFTFVLDRFLDAKEVAVAGNFNNWSRDGYKMYQKNGKWMIPLYLKPGKYLYKFIIDGKWILDPANKLWEDNEFGTGNSILWIEN